MHHAQLIYKLARFAKNRRFGAALKIHLHMFIESCHILSDVARISDCCCHTIQLTIIIRPINSSMVIDCRGNFTVMALSTCLICDFEDG